MVSALFARASASTASVALLSASGASAAGVAPTRTSHVWRQWSASTRSSFHHAAAVRTDKTVKGAVASAAASAASQRVQAKADQAVASAEDTASKLATSPASALKPTPAPAPAAAAAAATASPLKTGARAAGTVGRSVRNVLNATLFLVGGTLLFYYYRDSRAAIHRWIAIPALKHFLDPESAQKLAIDLLSSGVAPIDVVADDELLQTELFGMKLSNPLGLAAGFDKQAQAIDGLFDLGFGFVEVGSVTPEPQPGNPQPRYFRLLDDDAAINRFGFNSDGHAAVLARLRTRIDRWLLATDALAPAASSASTSGVEPGPLDSRSSVTSVPHTAEQLPDLIALDAEAALVRAGEVSTSAAASSATPRLSLRKDRLLSINLGKNKTTPEALAVRDYIQGIYTLGPYADILVVNVSSPNTPGLRDLQRAEVLGTLLGELVKARDDMLKEQEKLAAAVSCPSYTPSTTDAKRAQPLKPAFRVPLLVKISPDLSESELDDIAAAAKQAKVDGLIVSNTTVQRPRTLITSDEAVINEAGGLSGRPLKPLSLRALRRLSSKLDGSGITLIGCGGIFTGADALDFARAGASAVQVYTSFGYTGVGAPRRIKDELLELLKKEGKSWRDVVGADVRSASQSAVP